jgi:hypothetical protein
VFGFFLPTAQLKSLGSTIWSQKKFQIRMLIDQSNSCVTRAKVKNKQFWQHLIRHKMVVFAI